MDVNLVRDQVVDGGRGRKLALTFLLDYNEDKVIMTEDIDAIETASINDEQEKMDNTYDATIRIETLGRLIAFLIYCTKIKSSMHTKVYH